MLALYHIVATLFVDEEIDKIKWCEISVISNQKPA